VIQLTVIGIPSLTTSKVILFCVGISMLEKKKAKFIFELLMYYCLFILLFLCIKFIIWKWWQVSVLCMCGRAITKWTYYLLYNDVILKTQGQLTSVAAHMGAQNFNKKGYNPSAWNCFCYTSYLVWEALFTSAIRKSGKYVSRTFM